MKELTLKFTVDEEGQIHQHSENNGFEALEIIGMLELAKSEVLEYSIGKAIVPEVWPPKAEA